jgi:UDP-N-acetylmuramate dehydrogenase
MAVMQSASEIEVLRSVFGERLRENVQLARYTTARVGGCADAFLEVKSSEDLASSVLSIWDLEMPFVLLGGGSNVLISDAGVRGIVILNKTGKIRFDEIPHVPTVWAESGVNLSLIARHAATRGLSGLEWAGGIPGTLGGAVVGNAGAHSSDIASTLRLAEILHLEDGRQSWIGEQFGFQYRSSVLKRNPGEAIVLSATLELKHNIAEDIKKTMDTYRDYRRSTQPRGSTMGSMFKNPPNDYAGRLIEAAGLKGFRVGDAQISPVHANFFINLGRASASDVMSLIYRAQNDVLEMFDVSLELEIELLGEWDEPAL